MNLIRAALDRPVAVISAVLMTILFGYVALQQIPIQLTPDVRKPVLSIQTFWGGASPAEVEREIINRQEEVLTGLEGVEEMESTSDTGRATITLTFAIGTNMDRALLLVANRLDRVRSYPDEVQRPQIKTQGTDDNPIAWFIIRHLPANADKRPIHVYGDLVRDFVIERVERVKGVSGTNFFGGSDRELRVVVKPKLMAEYRLTTSDVLRSLRNANVAVTCGNVDEGKRSYTCRMEGELVRASAVRAVLVRSIRDTTSGRIARVTIGDIAEVKFGYKKPTARIRANGQSALVFNVLRSTGANVMKVMADVRKSIEDINQNVLKSRGLFITQVYDETEYIQSAINLVEQNIWVGGLIAMVILLLFLRSGRATLVVSLAIPVSVIGSFVAMAALGRSINVISLAGLAFAVGMVVDAAIVVLENIFRLREEGKTIRQAAYEGANQVWGAVLVSALTTVLVFVPILSLDLEVGQLFRDIAVAISVAVLLSLVVAVTLIPALANFLLKRPSDATTIAGAGGKASTAAKTSIGRLKNKIAPGGRLKLPVIDHFAGAFTWTILALTKVIVKSRVLSLVVVLAVCGGTATLTWLLLPKLEYLPTGNRNLVIAIALPPPGYNLATTTEVARKVEGQMRRWFVGEGKDTRVIKSVPGKDPPAIKRFFFVALSSRTFVGAVAEDPTRTRELIPFIRRILFSEPGTIPIVFQPSLFGRGIGGGRVIKLDISGPDLERNLQIALRAFLMANRLLPRSQGNQLRPVPGLELGAPEVRVLPNRLKLADAGVTARELADTVDVFNDGLRVVEINVGGRRIDLTLMGPEDRIKQTQGIGDIPVVTRSGTIVPVRSLAKIEITAGATQILHKERSRTVSIEIRPSPNLPLESAMEIVRDKIIAPLEKQGLPPGMKLTISGEADQLTKTWDAMVLQLLLAVVIVYLVMAILFESFRYPFIIMLSVPTATAGGVIALALVNEYVARQPLDMLTMLGFVILIGTVVNNAILLVHQGLRHMREDGMTVAEGIVESTRTRIRPIFMSTLTSVGGMLPLVLFPGAGSELYRGLGSVVVGGLALSALLTLVIIPPLMTLFVSRKEQGLEKKPALEPTSATPSPAAAAE